MRQAEGTRLKLETEYFRKSNNDLVRRQRRIRSVQLKGFHLLGVLVVVAASALLARQAADFVLHWDKLTVRTFQLHQAPDLPPGRLNAIFDRYRGNILAVDLKELEGRLLQLPEVKAVVISRQLPDTVRIDFTLRQPCFLYQGNGRGRVLDEAGSFIRMAAAGDERLLTICQTTPDDVLRIIPYLPGLRRIGHEVEYVAHRMPVGLEVKLRDHAEVFYPGDGDVAAKIQKYLALKKRITGDAAAVAYVDMRLEGRIYLGYAQSEGAIHEE